MRPLYVLTSLFALVVIGIVVLADYGLRPVLFAFVDALPGGDKVGHAALMGTLALLVTASLAPRVLRIGPLILPLGTALVLCAVTAEECSQLLFPARSFDIGDLASDVVGIALGAWVALRLRALRLQHHPRA